MRQSISYLFLVSTVISLFIWSCGSQATSSRDEAEVMVQNGFEIWLTDTLSIGNDRFAITAMKRTDEDSLMWDGEDEIPRPLFILKEGEPGIFKTLVRNDSVVMCGSCGGVFGDPVDNIVAEEGSFTVYHMGGSRFRWTRNIKFEYRSASASWHLVSDRGVGFDSLDPEGDLDQLSYTPGDSLGNITFENFNVNNY